MRELEVSRLRVVVVALASTLAKTEKLGGVCELGGFRGGGMEDGRWWMGDDGEVYVPFFSEG